MSVSRKLFLAMASFIVAMGLVFVFLTQVVMAGMFEYMLDVDRSEEIGELSALFVGYYEQIGGSWEGVQEEVAVSRDVWSDRRESGFLLVSEREKLLASEGEAEVALIKGLGIRSELRSNGDLIGFLYYYDREIANLSKLRLGVGSSVTFLLLAGAVVFVLLSLAVAYWFSKRLTAPLRLLIPALDHFGKGEFGIQAPVVTQDEYGKVAQAFNEMSTQIQRAENARRQLVADVAHELRTPLTVMRGKLDLVQQSGHSIEPESLLPIQDELIRLTRLVDDLQQLSLAEAKKLPMERKPTDMAGLLRRILERISPDAEEKGIEVAFDCRTDRVTVEADPNRITQVFLNLLVNAVRYTPEGGAVTVTVEEVKAEVADKEEADAGGGRLRIAVADTGPGIEPEHLPFVFNRFYRSDEARARNSGGMGLGLAIAKEFVAAHQGRIEVESRLGQGTVFIVELPFA